MSPVALYWLIVGSLAALGGYALVLQILHTAHVEWADWFGYAAHAFGAGLAGITLQLVRPTKRLQAPVAAGILVVGVMVLLAYSPTNYDWVGRRDGLGSMAVIAAICAACMLAGAVAARRHAVEGVAVVMLVVLVSFAMWTILQNVARAFGFSWGVYVRFGTVVNEDHTIIGTYLVGGVIAGALVQWQMAVRCSIACIVGGAIFVVLSTGPFWERLSDVPIAWLVGLPIAAIAGSWTGSRLPRLQGLEPR